MAVEVVKERLKSVFGAAEARIQPRSMRRQQGGAMLWLWGPRPTGVCMLHAVP